MHTPHRMLTHALATLALLLVTTCAAETVTLQLKWRHGFQFAGYYAAVNMGYYREAGLDVAIQEAAPGQNVVEEVLSGRADFGVGTSSLLLERHAGKPVVALAVLFQHSPYIILTAKRPDIRSIQDMVHKRIMLEPLSGELVAYLKHVGIPSHWIKRQEHSFDIRDLIHGRVDAMSAYITNEPYGLRQLGFEYQIFSPRSADVDFYGDNLFTTEQNIARRPETVRAFRTASLRGWVYAAQHPDEIIRLIRDRYNTQGFSQEYLQYEAEQVRELMQHTMIPVGYMFPARWAQIADFYAEIDLLPKNPNLDGFLYDPDNRQDGGERYLQAGVFGAGLAIGAALGFLLHRRRRATTPMLPDAAAR